MTKPDDDTRDLDDIARVFRVTPPTVRKWTHDGLPVVERGTRGGARHRTRISLRAAVGWYFASHGERLALIRARTRLAHEQSETARLKNEATRTNLVPADLLEHEFCGLLGHIIHEARKIPDQLAPQLEGQTIAQRKATLEKAIFDLLDRSVEWRPDSKTIAAEG